MNLNTLKSSRLVHLCFAITYFTTGLAINVIQCTLYLTLHKIDKRLYRKINYYLCYSLYSLLVFLGDWWSGSKVILYADKSEYKKYFGKEHAYCVMNHTYEVDWVMGWIITERLGLLGNCKAYAKKAVQFLPILGWCWKFSEFVFLERSFEKDKENIIRQVEALSDHPDPMWLLLFPEGTRFSQAKHEASQKFALEKNYKQLNYHLQPRTRGFIASLPGMQGKVGAIYDILLAFKEDDPVKPTITNLLFGRPMICHMYIRRIPLEQVPESVEEQDKLMREMFQRKDELKESFVKTGDFFKLSGHERYEGIDLGPPRIYPLLNMIFWILFTTILIISSLINFLLSGSFICFTLSIALLIASYFLLRRTIGMSKISKQSSYGVNKGDTKSE